MIESLTYTPLAVFVACATPLAASAPSPISQPPHHCSVKNMHAAPPPLFTWRIPAIWVYEQSRPLLPGLLWSEALTALVPLPSLRTECGSGFGLAACPASGLLVTSDYYKKTLSVWGLPDGVSSSGGNTSGGAAGACVGGAWAGGGGGGLRLVSTLGGDGSAAPMHFKFEDVLGRSGYLAFMPPAATNTSGSSGSSSAHPLLLVTDAGHDAVHLVDVVGGSHAGYLASPGSIAGPRSVAVSRTSPLVAVSAWKRRGGWGHVVVVYRGSGAVWEVVRVIRGGFGGPGARDRQLRWPYGLRFSGDGDGICVADLDGRVSVFPVGDGGFVRHLATGLRGRNPYDVEAVEGGWLVACKGSHTVEFVCDSVGGDQVGGGRPSLGKAGGGHGSGDGEFWFPVALAVVPGLGLVVRESGNNRLQVFATPDAIAMAAMSCMRVAWMVSVARAVRRRSLGVSTPSGAHQWQGLKKARRR